jgi:hypothetical protein
LQHRLLLVAFGVSGVLAAFQGHPYLSYLPLLLTPSLMPQIAVLANHQNGRDTHMRQVLVYGPAGVAAPGLGDVGLFESSEFSCYSTMR